MDEQKKLDDSKVKEGRIIIEDDSVDLNNEYVTSSEVADSNKETPVNNQESKEPEVVKAVMKKTAKKATKKTVKKVVKKKIVKKKVVKKKVVKKRAKKKKSNWKRPLLIIAALVIIIILAVIYIRPANIESSDDSEIVAFVDGVSITSQDVFEQKEIMSAAVPDLIISEGMALNQTIIRVLLLNSADASNIEVPEDFIDLNIESVKGRFASEEDFFAALADQGVTFEEYKQSVVEQVKIDLFVGQQFLNISVSEDEILDVFEQNEEALIALGYSNYSLAKPALENNLLEAKKQVILKELILDLMADSRVVYGPFSDEDLFAVCLSNSGATYYTSYWCGPCASQKEVFGESFDYLNVVDCSKGLEQGEGQISACDNEGIEAYPTWIVGDGSYPGVKSLDFLAEKSGC